MKVAIRWYIVIWLVLAGVYGPACALDAREVETLEEIQNYFQGLATVNPVDQYQYDGGTDYDWGGSWSKSVSEICDGGDGWAVHGLYCFEGHISSIRLTGSWSELNGPYPSLSGLQWLQNLTIALAAGTSFTNDAEMANFTGRLLTETSVKRVEYVGVNDPFSGLFPSSSFRLANLTHVHLEFTGSWTFPDFSLHTHLEEVYIRSAHSISNFDSFLASAATLRSLQLQYCNIINPSGLYAFVGLQKLQFWGIYPPTSAYNSNLILPPNLKHLHIGRWGSASLSIGNETDLLESIVIDNLYIATGIEYLPKNLKSISVISSAYIQNWHIVAPGDCLVESFSITDSTNSVIPPWLGQCERLKSLSLSNVAPSLLDILYIFDFRSTALEELEVSISAFPQVSTPVQTAIDFICNLPPNLKRLNLQYTQYADFPACVSQFTQLEALVLTGLLLSPLGYILTNFSSSIVEIALLGTSLGGLEANGWAEMALQFPNLKKLQVLAGSSSIPFPSLPLMSLRHLEHLILVAAGLTGSIHPEFLEALPNLKTLNLAQNALVGTIPMRGWQNLESVDLNSNFFSAWPYLTSPGAPNLKSLILVELPLESLPNDATWLSMTNLRDLYLNGISGAVRLPAFWANGQHKLRRLSATFSKFQGTLPSSISTPYLRFLEIFGNKICGPLPQITSPVSFNSLDLSSLQLSGTIPSSWGQNFTILGTLYLSNNLLQGTIPHPFLSRYSGNTFIAARFLNNYLSGPIPDMSNFTKLREIDLRGDNMTIEWCTRDPHFGSVIQSYSGCYLSYASDYSICDCISTWQGCNSGLTAHCTFSPDFSSSPSISSPNGRNPIIPPNDACITPSESYPAPPSSQTECPLPSPGSTFTCINGVWKAFGSIIIPILTVPGAGSGVSIAIDGSLTITEGITFSGLSSQLFVNGCIFLGDSPVTIELTKEDIEQLEKEKSPLTKTLVSTTGTCAGSSDLSGIVVNVASDLKKCQKLKTQNSGSSPTSLVVAFSIDSGSCNTKWIILGSVLGGVVVLGAISAVLLVTFNSTIRTKIRPFSKPK